MRQDLCNAIESLSQETMASFQSTKHGECEHAVWLDLRAPSPILARAEGGVGLADQMYRFGELQISCGLQ